MEKPLSPKEIQIYKRRLLSRQRLDFLPYARLCAACTRKGATSPRRKT